MLDLHKDLFVTLCVSAQKFADHNTVTDNSTDNSTDTVISTVDNVSAMHPITAETTHTTVLEDSTPESLHYPTTKSTKSIEQTLIDVQKPLSMTDTVTALTPVSKAAASKNVKSSKVKIPKKIDEQVLEIIDDPEIQTLKDELLKAEHMLQSLKHAGEDKAFIQRLEEKIYELKVLVDKQSYV